MIRPLQILFFLALLSCASKKIESPAFNYREVANTDSNCHSVVQNFFPLLREENKTLQDNQYATIESILEPIRENFEKNFKNGTSLNPSEALKKYIKENPTSSEILSSILNKEYSFAIHFPNKYMDGILENGFLNQHETGYGGGIEGLAIRNSAESSMSAVPIEFYKKISPHIKPKYGMLWPDIDSDIKHSTIPEYGDYVFILKKENLVKKTTWTPLDSLNQITQAHWRNLENESFISNLDWYQQFIPLDNISLATIFLHEFNKVSFSSKKLGSYYYQKTEIGHSSRMRTPPRVGSYLELQIWGQITAKDVDALVFLGEPPSTEAFMKLKELDIKIYDGRSGLRTLWNP